MFCRCLASASEPVECVAGWPIRVQQAGAYELPMAGDWQVVHSSGERVHDWCAMAGDSQDGAGAAGATGTAGPLVPSDCWPT